MPERPQVPLPIDARTLEEMTTHIESQTGQTHLSWPRVSSEPLPAAPTADSSEEAWVPLIWNPDFRKVIGLPTFEGPMASEQAAGYFDRLTGDVVVNHKPTWTSQYTEGVLVHELAHAADRTPSSANEPRSWDSGSAEWAQREGFAGTVERRWVHPEYQSWPVASGGLSVDEAVVRQAEARLGYEQRRQRSGYIPQSVAANSVLPFFDLSVPLDWAMTEVEPPPIPLESRSVVHDVLGVRGLLELSSARDTAAQVAFSGWRGDNTAFFDLEGTDCIMSRIVFVDEPTALQAFIALRLPGMRTHLYRNEVELFACGSIERELHQTEVSGFQVVGSVATLAIAVADAVRFGDSEEFAMCIARAEHMSGGSTGQSSWSRDQAIASIVRHTAECRQ